MNRNSGSNLGGFFVGKSYTAEEEIHRFEIFKENIQKIEEHNKLYHLGKKSYYMGVNQFSDLVRVTSLNFQKLQANLIISNFIRVQPPF